MNQSSKTAALLNSSNRGRLNLQRLSLFLGMAAVYYFALHGIAFIDIWHVLRGLSLWQISLLLFINCVNLIAMTLRWWLVARVDQPRLPFARFIAYRLAVFGVSYFTPGPQVGGEPLQTLYLCRHGISLPRAVAVIIIDKALELTGNFIFISLGIFAAFRQRLFSWNSVPGLASMLVLLLLLAPPVYLLLMRSGSRPTTSLVSSLPPRLRKNKGFRMVRIAEQQAASFTRRKPTVLMAALSASLLSSAAIAGEYMLMLKVLNINLPLGASLAALAISMLAFLMPLPGGLGALEASQVLALGFLGYPAALAISLTLLMRLRDLLNGSLGLLIAARLPGLNPPPQLAEPSLPAG